MRNSIKNYLRKTAQFWAGVTTSLMLYFVAQTGCAVLVVAAVLAVLFGSMIVLSKDFSKRGKITLVAIVVIVALVIGLGHLATHKEEKHEEIGQQETVETDEESTDEVADAEEEVVVEETNNSNTSTASTGRRKAVSGSNLTDGSYIAPTYESSSNSNPDSGTSTVTGNTVTEFKPEGTTPADEKMEEEIKDAEKDPNKEVIDLEEDIKAIVDVTPKPDDKKDESTKIDESKEKVSNEVSTEEVIEEEIPTSESSEVVEEEDLEKLLDQVTDTVTDDRTSEKVELEEIPAPVKPEAPVVTEETTKVETPVEEKPVVEEKKADAAVKVTPVDGYTTTVGSDIQFKVSGDNVKFDGLQGVSYNYSNGYLNIQAGSEATVLTVEAYNATNSIVFDITVNGNIN